MKNVTTPTEMGTPFKRVSKSFPTIQAHRKLSLRHISQETSAFIRLPAQTLMSCRFVPGSGFQHPWTTAAYTLIFVATNSRPSGPPLHCRCITSLLYKTYLLRVCIAPLFLFTTYLLHMSFGSSLIVYCRCITSFSFLKPTYFVYYVVSPS